MVVERKVRLTYPKQVVNQPLMYELIRRFDLLTNIIEAQVSPNEAWLTLVLRGEAAKLQQGLSWLAEQGVRVEDLSAAGEGGDRDSSVGE